MKMIELLLMGVILMTSPPLLFGQNVMVPDAVFKAYLVADTSINTNGDNEVQVAEATNFTGSINIYGLGVTDLTGIEAFTALSNLDCGNNNLGSIDISANTALTVLYCNNSQLSALDVSNNTALTELSCYQNLLTGINLSNNSALTRFFAFNNQFTSLDLSNNPLLTRLFCQNNQLTSLNVQNGNNSNFTHFNATMNPNLACIEVDSVAYSDTNWDHIDPGAVFSVNCFTPITNLAQQPLQIYPNPSQGPIYLEQVAANSTILLSNASGQEIWRQSNHQASTMSLNLPTEKGLYFLQILHRSKIETYKILKY